MAFLIFDYSNTNVLHRTALLRAINNINAMGIEHEDITVVVSTRNMIRSLPHVIFGRMKTVINIVGFGVYIQIMGFLAALFLIRLFAFTIGQLLAHS